MLKYTKENGDEIYLGDEIGKGGEASVFSVQGRNNLVAKIYNDHHAIDEQKLEKLKTMCDLYDYTIAEYYAWPQEIIYIENKPVGFIMENINTTNNGISEYIKFINFYQLQARRKNFPNIEYKFMVHVALNFAKAISTLHEKGIVIGDINESNVFVNNENATTKLIDCDSYQIGDFLCDVGKPEYTAPELPTQLRGFKRTTNHDCFALAIMIFLILVNKHPYTGIGTPPEIRQSIQQGLYCYSRDIKNKNISASFPFSEIFALLNEEIKELFEKAFTSENRPTAKDWISALEKYENELIKCSNNDTHWYHPNYHECIWCNLETEGFTAFGQPKTKNNKLVHNYNRQTPYKVFVKQTTNNKTNNKLTSVSEKNSKKLTAKNIWLKYFIIIILIIFAGIIINTNFNNGNNVVNGTVAVAKQNITRNLNTINKACSYNDIASCSSYFNTYYNELKKQMDILNSNLEITTDKITKINSFSNHNIYGIKITPDIQRKDDCSIYGRGCIENISIDDPILQAYKLPYAGESIFQFVINIDYLYNNFYNYLSRDWQDYLVLRKKEQDYLGSNTFYQDGSTYPGKKVLVQWLLALQQFNKKYPNFAQHDEIQKDIELYTSNLIWTKYTTFGDNDNLLPEAKQAMIEFLEKTDKNTKEYNAVKESFDILKKYNYKYSEEFSNHFHNM